MDDRASDARGSLETLALAALGAVAVAAGRADELADDVASRLGVDREDVRNALADAFASWLREAKRMAESSGEVAERVAAELGVASREAVEELELRVAQLEHRLKLLERSS